MRRLSILPLLFLAFIAASPVSTRVLAGKTARSSAPAAASKHDSVAPAITDLQVSNGGRPWKGDKALFTTISPNGDGLRDRAAIRFKLSESATVTLVMARTRRYATPIYSAEYKLGAGSNTLYWEPETPLEPNSYLVQLYAVDDDGNHSKLAPNSILEWDEHPSAVVRVMGVDAGFTRASYGADEKAAINIEADASSLELQFFHAGPETDNGNLEMKMYGVPVSSPKTIPWMWKNRPHAVGIRIGHWPTGVYYLRLTADDGRVGYAAFVLHPDRLGGNRIAVVMPAYTWQAYNFRDENQDGFGDTWYAGPPMESARLGRTQLNYGGPPKFSRFESNFLRWLAQTHQNVDYIADIDLEKVRSGDQLAKLYDLMVWPNHTEYETMHNFTLMKRYRDQGGNLIFLSANNFFWKIVVDKQGVMHRIIKYRDIGYPEAAWLGMSYRGNDQGQKRPPYIVRNVDAAPWFWNGTGLAVGSAFGHDGIEIDHTTSDSPPNIIVLAEIPDIYRPGVTAQMTYYETAAGAKVFAAGTLDFCATVLAQPERRLLENLWQRLSVP